MSKTILATHMATVLSSIQFNTEQGRNFSQKTPKSAKTYFTYTS